MVKIIAHKTDYSIYVDGITCTFNNLDFSVGEGEGYDFTIDECVEADINEIRTAFYNDDREIADDDFSAAWDAIYNYYASHNN